MAMESRTSRSPATTAAWRYSRAMAPVGSRLPVAAFTPCPDLYFRWPAAIFNGDGITDLVTCGEEIIVLMGNGTGGFTLLANAVPGGGPGAASADFDGDGITDLTFVTNNGVTVYPGNGDGTFRTGDLIPVTGAYETSQLTAHDFNGDGRQDLGVIDLRSASGYELAILLGTSANTSSLLTATAPSSAAPNTFRLQAVVSPAPAFTNPTGTVRFFDGNALLDEVPAQNGAASTTVPLSAGQHSLSAIYQGDTRTLPSTSNTLSLTIDLSSRTPQVITMRPITDRVFSTFQVSVVATSDSKSGIPVVLSVVSGPATVGASQQIGGLLKLTGAGTVTVQATQDGNSQYLAATPVTTQFTVTLATPDDYGKRSSGNFWRRVRFSSPASASSGLPVAYQPGLGSGYPEREYGCAHRCGHRGDSGLAGRQLRICGGSSGLFQHADIPGAPGHHVSGDRRSLCFGQSLSVNATASSGLVVSLSVSGPGKITGNLLTITGPGQITVTATQAGDSDFLPAAAVIQYANVYANVPRMLRAS